MMNLAPPTPPLKVRREDAIKKGIAYIEAAWAARPNETITGIEVRMSDALPSYIDIYADIFPQPVDFWAEMSRHLPPNFRLDFAGYRDSGNTYLLVFKEP